MREFAVFLRSRCDRDAWNSSRIAGLNCNNLQNTLYCQIVDKLAEEANFKVIAFAAINSNTNTVTKEDGDKFEDIKRHLQKLKVVDLYQCSSPQNKPTKKLFGHANISPGLIVGILRHSK